MSTATTPAKPTNGLAAQLPGNPAGAEIPLNQIAPSPTNPRKTFNEAYLKNLAGTIKDHGVLQDITLRKAKATFEDVKRARATGATPTFAPGDDVFQIVVGECRFRASVLAGKATIPGKVRELTDEQVLEIQVIENQQREDVHPLEEALGYRALMAQNKDKYTPEAIAERVKKSVSYIYGRMQLTTLTPEIQQAFLDGKITASHAIEICRLQPKQQEQCFLECFGGATDYGDDREYDTVKEVGKDKEAEASVGVRRLRSYIQDKILCDLSKAPFDTKDEFLLKGVGACGPCPKRAGSNPGLFGEVAKGDTCTDPGCYEAKKEALVQLKISEAQRKAAPKPEPAPVPKEVLKSGFSQTAAKAAEPVKKAEPAPPPVEIQKISSEHLGYQEKGKPDVLYPNDYNLAKPGCKKEKKAIWADGPKIGQFTHLCDVKNCSNHGYYSSGSTGPREPISFERRKEIWGQKVQYVYRNELLSLIAAKLPSKIGDTEVSLLSEHIIRTLPHRDSQKVALVLGLEDGDIESLELYMRKLKPAMLAQFIVICALVEELGTDDLAFGGDLEKDSSLMIAAKAYKVDHQKLLDAAKAQLESKRPKTAAEKAQAEKKTKPVQTSGKATPPKKAKAKKTKK